jgi:N-acetylglucosaminyldiphosphoundecaprenol N-acetyl-beta-D-mannosaminyltransferase
VSEAPARFVMNGVVVDAVDLDDATDWILERSQSGDGAAVHTINAHALSLARRSPAHAEILAAAELNVPDGMPVVWAARRLGFPLTERAYGPDVTELAVDRGRQHDVRHLLYGGTPEAVAGAVDVLRERYPGALVEGLSPPYRATDEEAAEEAVDLLAERDEHVVWVCLGAPRQDVVMARVRPTSTAVLVGVGAAVDFLAGTAKQAPPLLQRLGLEWAYRLATEPRRLARRYATGNWDLIRGVLEHRPVRLD